jgi:hypothetical protein
VRVRQEERKRKFGEEGLTDPGKEREGVRERE